MSAPGQEEKGGASEALRSAIERTFAATVEGATETRERAGELLDDVAKRGQDAREEVTRRSLEAREEVTRRGQEARDEVTRRGQEAREGVTGRISTTIQKLRGVDVSDMQNEIDTLRRRVAELEQQLRKSKPKRKG